MKESTLMDETDALEDTLAEIEERVGELRAQLRVFSSPTEPGSVPTELPPDFDYVRATDELNKLLQKRHSTSTKYKEIVARAESAKREETARKLADLKRIYKDVIIRMLQSAVSFARAVADAEGIRSQAFDVSGSWANLYAIGPPTGRHGQWSLEDYTSLPCHWLREAKAGGIVDGSEEWLRGINF